MYTIEVKDEFGWCDHSTFETVEEALKLAAELKESFNGNVKVIDVANQLEVAQ